MSDLLKILSLGAGYVLLAFVIGGIVLVGLSMLLMWLVPIATAGAVSLGFLQAIAISTLGFILRIAVIK
jgi:hypothetical protein